MKRLNLKFFKMCGGLFSFCFLHETVFGNGQIAITHNYWLTTPVVEILEEIKNDDVHYVRFMTENSEYEWWTGVHPKQKTND